MKREATRRPEIGAPLWRDAYVENVQRAKDDSGERTLDVVASDETVDRYGDVISADGWDLRAFKRNPIFLWTHDYGYPIGRVPDIKVVGKRLLASVQFAAEGISATADELWKMVEAKILRAVSVGFTIASEKDYEFIYDDEENITGIRYLQQELLEISLVAVPANPNALAIGRSLQISQSTLSRALQRDASVIEAHRTTHSRILRLRISGQRLHVPRRAAPLTPRGSRQ